jgi:hypothetical protein
MPPRSYSSSSSPLCVDQYDAESVYEPVYDLKEQTKGALPPLTKSARFSETNEVFPIKHLDEFSDEEVRAIWYDANEYAEIKNNYKATIFMMECGKQLHEHEHTSRGLEYRTQEGAWARYENKRDAYNAVLDEQDLQWKEDTDDWDALSRAYLEHSSKCAKAAFEIGLQDAEEAHNIYANLYQKDKSKKGIKTLKRVFGKKS